MADIPFLSILNPAFQSMSYSLSWVKATLCHQVENNQLSHTKKLKKKKDGMNMNDYNLGSERYLLFNPCPLTILCSF